MFENISYKHFFGNKVNITQGELNARKLSTKILRGDKTKAKENLRKRLGNNKAKGKY